MSPQRLNSGDRQGRRSRPSPLDSVSKIERGLDGRPAGGVSARFWSPEWPPASPTVAAPYGELRSLANDYYGMHKRTQ
jgi:hypothetical protein